MIRGNLGMAMQGLAVVPLFAGYDPETARRPDLQLRRHRRPLRGAPPPLRRLRLDVRPRRAQEALARGPHAARGRSRVAIEALYDAADDDSATGGPDLARGIYPVVAVVDADGYRRVPDDELDPIVRAVVAARQTRPDGPVAPITG